MGPDTDLAAIKAFVFQNKPKVSESHELAKARPPLYPPKKAEPASTKPSEPAITRPPIKAARNEAGNAKLAAPSVASPDNEIWEEPLHFGRVDVPDIPPSLLPGVLGEYAAALTESLQTPPAAATVYALVILSAAIQRKFVVEPQSGYFEPVSVWVLLVQDSGERKTPLINAMRKPLTIWEAKKSDAMKGEIDDVETRRAVLERRIEKLQGDAAKVDGAIERDAIVGEINELRSQIPSEVLAPRVFTGDTTPEQLQNLLSAHGRMAVLSDEGGIFSVMAGMYSGGESYVDAFLQAYSGSPIRVDRGSRVVVVDRPALTMGIGFQPGMLQDMAPAAKRKFRNSGLFARFFLLVPTGRVGRRNMRSVNSVCPHLENRYRGLIMSLLDIEESFDESGELQERTLQLSPAARIVWEDFSQWVEDEQAEGGRFESMRDWCAKIAGGAARVAGLLEVAVSGASATVVSEDSMGRACDICRLLIPHAEAVFDLTGGEQSVEDAKVIWRWIEKQRQPMFKRNDLHQAHRGRFTDVNRLVDALKVLTGRSLISDEMRVPTGGRPTVVYKVNPSAIPGGF